MLTLTLRDLQYRKWRVLLTTALMSIIITLLFIMAGLVGQFDREPFVATQRIGEDRDWLVAEGSTGPLTSPEPFASSLVADIEGAVPFLISPGSVGSEQATIVGRSSVGFAEPALTSGRYAAGDDEIVVDSTLGLDTGDRTTLGGSEVTVVGTTDDATVTAGSPLVFATLDAAAVALVGGEDVVTGALVTTTPAAMPAGLRLMTPEEVGEDGLVPLEDAVASVSLVVTLLWLVTAIVIAAMVYIGALERTRDFAVLKAVGGRTRSLAASLLAQGVLMTLLATLVAMVLQSFVGPSFPLRVSVPGSAFVQIPVVGTVIALLAGSGGVWRMSRTSPAEAFA